MAEGSIDVLELGASPPPFTLTGVDGNTHSLDDLTGELATLIVFTCNHCPYAKAKVPLLNEIASEYDDVSVVGINPNANDDYPDDSFDRMCELVEDGTIEYDAYLYDEEQSVAADYGAVCTPDPFLFDTSNASSELVYHGRLDDAPNPDDEPERIEITEAIESLRRGDPITIEQRPARGCSIKWRAGNEPDYWDRI